MGRLVTRSNCSARHAWTMFAGVPRGEINALTRIFVSRTALGTQTPAPSAGCSGLLHGLCGITTCIPCRDVPVLGPYPIKHREESVASFRQGLIPIERDHRDHRVALFLNDHRVFFPANPTKQRGELVLGTFDATGLDHMDPSLLIALTPSVHRGRMRIQGKFSQSSDCGTRSALGTVFPSADQHLWRSG